MTPGAEQSQVRLSREQLYALVWSEPMTKLSARFGLSDVGLAKHCRAMAVPLPPRGYWAKLAAGKNPAKIRLLATPKGTPEFLTLTTVPDESKPRPPKPKKPAPAEGESMPALPLPDTVPRLHHLVSVTKTALLQDAKKSAGQLCSAYGPECLTVRSIGKANIDRVCRILHVVITTLEKRGHTVQVDKHETKVRIGAETVRFRVEEQKDTRPYVMTAADLAKQKADRWWKPPRYESVPTGDLIFRLEEYVAAPRKSWRDGKRRSLDNLLMDIVLGIEAVGEASRLQTEERERQRLEWAEQRRRHAILEQRQREENARFEALVQAASAWDLSHRIAAYADVIEQNAQARGQANDPDVRRWIEWARREAARLDPARKELPTRAAEWDEPPDFGQPGM